jgi:hypothetical protein
MIKQHVLKLMILTILLSGCSKDRSESVEKNNNEAKPEYIVLNEDLNQLVNDFNKHKGKLRQLFIVGPTCGICLRGMADLNDEYIQAMQSEPRMQTFVVHVPTMGAEEKDVAPTIPLLSGSRVTHYWDEEGYSGRDFREVLGIDMYAWDVWLLFDPDVIWDIDSLPPQPIFWQHQLGGLPKSQKLDKKIFAKEVKRQIGLLPEMVEKNMSTLSANNAASKMIPVGQPRGVIIGQHIKMRGGYRQLKTISSVTYKGFTESSGVKYPLTIEAKRPSIFIRTIEKDDRSLSAKWDGETASFNDEAPMLIPKSVMNEILHGFDFDGWMVEWKDKGHHLWRLGMKKMKDKLPWVMEVELPNGQTWHMYIDSHSGDQIRTLIIDKDGNETFVIEYSDFKEIDGFRMPHQVRYIKNDQLLATDNYTNIEISMADEGTEVLIKH